jgi:predicted cupin superfamily sugar epimerase
VTSDPKQATRGILNEHESLVKTFVVESFSFDKFELGEDKRFVFKISTHKDKIISSNLVI